MRECSNEDVKRISLEILLELDRVCRENGLLYSIAYGTLLGAVRHQGFIPWDDDIDVIMPRADYEKLLTIQDKLNDRYRLVSTDTDEKYTAPLVKLIDSSTLLRETHHNDCYDLGIYIDIFVFDYVPQNEMVKRALYAGARSCMKMWGFATYNPRTNLKIEKAGRRWTLKHNAGRKASVIVNRWGKKQKQTEWMTNLLYSVYGYIKDTFPAEKILSVSPILFEGNNVLAFSDRELFLKQWYGDYMKLPPVEKRITHHNFEAYFKDDIN